MIKPGSVISYLDMCQEEGVNLQRGMNYHLATTQSVILMSLRPNAPYADRIEAEGKILIYEGHDVPKAPGKLIPKNIDQTMTNPIGSLTQNGLFFEAAQKYKIEVRKAELVRVYEKIHKGIWTYNGLFKLIDAWQESSDARKVFKFRLELLEDEILLETDKTAKVDTDLKDLEHNRLIPASVKLEVWKRDKGKCVICGSNNNLHFDHIIPYSKGGSSLVADNIQLLCARHNIAKKDKIE
jgi:hypothetical protein